MNDRVYNFLDNEKALILSIVTQDNETVKGHVVSMTYPPKGTNKHVFVMLNTTEKGIS